MKTINTEEMIIMIEIFMSLKKNDTYIMDDKNKFMFVGNVYQVQEKVLEWLSSPPRLENIKMMKEYIQSPEQVFYCRNCANVFASRRESKYAECSRCHIIGDNIIVGAGKEKE